MPEKEKNLMKDHFSRSVQEYFSEICDCGLVPEHKRGFHDYTCQNCGAMHHDSICPEVKG